VATVSGGLRAGSGEIDTVAIRSFNTSRSRTGIASTPCGRMTRNLTLTPPSRRFDRTWTGSRSLER